MAAGVGRSLSFAFCVQPLQFPPVTLTLVASVNALLRHNKGVDARDKHGHDDGSALTL